VDDLTLRIFDGRSRHLGTGNGSRCASVNVRGFGSFDPNGAWYSMDIPGYEKPPRWAAVGLLDAGDLAEPALIVDVVNFSKGKCVEVVA